MTDRSSLSHLGLQSMKNLHLYSVLLATLFTWSTGAQDLKNHLEVRLVGGSSLWEGLVEVFYQGEWGSVCDDNWDINEGSVVCWQLGYQSVVKVTHAPLFPFGLSEKPVVLDQIHCTGKESNLGQCFGVLGTEANDCVPLEAAGVVCEPQGNPQLFLQVRLTDGSVPWKGLVEVFYQGQWGSVCDDSWDMEDGLVVCRQLGYKSVVRVTTAGWSNLDDWPFGISNKPILLDDMQCTGSEATLGHCIGKFGATAHDCTQNESAGVVCAHDEDGAPLTTVRLVNGGGQWRGRVEVYYNGQWGTVCDDGWTFEDAQVVCRQLGFYGALKTYEGARFGSGTLPILLDDTACHGTEPTIQDCYGNWGEDFHNCDHLEDAGLECRTDGALPNIRLDGPHPNQGRVEIFLNDDWGTVCDDSWHIEEANVVCRQLGYSGAVQAVAGGTFGEGYGYIHLDEVQCEGHEASIYLCGHNAVGEHNCNHAEDAGVVCQSDKDPNYVAIPPSSTDATLGEVGFTVMGVVFPACLVLTLCLVCRNLCKNNNSNTERTNAQPAQANSPYTSTMEYTSVPLAPPPASVPPLRVFPPSAGNVIVRLPSAPDLPPTYNSVMEDPSKFAFPPGQIPADSNRDIPITPPPEYTPQAVVFNTETNSVNLVTAPSATLR